MQLHKRMNWASIWQILQAFARREIPEKTACKWLSISRARLYILKRRWQESKNPQKEGMRWFYQRGASCRLPEKVRSFLAGEIEYLKKESTHFKNHFNFAFLAQECHKRFGKRYHRNTIRLWAVREGLYKPGEDSTRKPCIRFEMGAVGVLFQHDASLHAWLPLTKRMDQLIITVDDHSRKVVGALLVPRETAWHHLCVVRQTVETYGCPFAYYTDNAAFYVPKKQLHTQFSRVLASLEISLKLTGKAHPQAKGKVEKRFDYFQRRIPLLCERYNITSLTQANKILVEEVNYFNQEHIHAETQETPEKRWQKALSEGRSLLRPIPEKTPMDLIFTLEYKRLIRNDSSMSFAGRSWKIPGAPIKKKVSVFMRPPVTRRPHTEIWVQFEGSTLAHFFLNPREVMGRIV